MTLSQSAVLKLYTSVMEDVIAGVRESFLDDGVDEQVLQELKQTWESKLHASKAVDQINDAAEPQPMSSLLRNTVKLGGVRKTADASSNQSGFVIDSSSSIRAEKLYPVQITLPAQQGSDDPTPRVLTIQVPESAITGNQLQAVLTGPLISTTLSLPTPLATSLLQQHVTAALRGQQAGSLIAARPFSLHQGNGTASQVDGAHDESDEEPTTSTACPSTQGRQAGPVRVQRTGLFRFRVNQMDGGNDTSDEDDDDDEEEDLDDEEEEKDEEPEYVEGAVEEEPLNSGDDVSEEDVTDLFDTDNVVVCQYDKITRSRNKWKFYLKDGIMNLSGRDFVFHKSNGDAEW